MICLLYFKCINKFFRCSPLPVPCSSTQTPSGRDEKRCDVIFYSTLDTLVEGNGVGWLHTPKRSETRNRSLGSSPGKTFKPRKTKLLIVTPSVSRQRARRAEPVSREHVLLCENAEPRVKRIVSARLKADSGFKFWQQTAVGFLRVNSNNEINRLCFSFKFPQTNLYEKWY